MGWPGEDRPITLENTQKAGLTLFIDKGCTACHSGVNVGGTMYQKFGVVAEVQFGQKLTPDETAMLPAILHHKCRKCVLAPCPPVLS